MDPIDFTKPEIFSQSGASHASGLDGATEAVASNPEGAQRLRRRLGSAVFWTLLMLLVWGAGAALLTLASQQALPSASALRWPPDGPQLLANSRS